jgi:hypothetical protein
MNNPLPISALPTRHVEPKKSAILNWICFGAIGIFLCFCLINWFGGESSKPSPPNYDETRSPELQTVDSLFYASLAEDKTLQERRTQIMGFVRQHLKYQD